MNTFLLLSRKKIVRDQNYYIPLVGPRPKPPPPPLTLQHQPNHQTGNTPHLCDNFICKSL